MLINLIIICFVVLSVVFIIWDYRKLKTKKNIVSINKSLNQSILSLEVAKRIIHDYGKVLSISPEGGARKISLLKNSKDEIKQAIKFVIQFEVYNKTLTQKLYFDLTSSLNYLGRFIDDKEAEKVNFVYQNSNATAAKKRYALSLIQESKLSFEEKKEVEEIVKNYTYKGKPLLHGIL